MLLFYHECKDHFGVIVLNCNSYFIVIKNWCPHYVQFLGPPLPFACGWSSFGISCPRLINAGLIAQINTHVFIQIMELIAESVFSPELNTPYWIFRNCTGSSYSYNIERVLGLVSMKKKRESSSSQILLLSIESVQTRVRSKSS